MLCDGYYPETRELYPELKKIEIDIQTIKLLVAKCLKMPRKTAKLGFA